MVPFFHRSESGLSCRLGMIKEWKNDGMDLNMGCGVGMPLSFLCLALLLFQLSSFNCKGHQFQERALPANFQFTHFLYNATIYENSAARTYANSKVKMGISLTDPSWDVKYRIISGDDDSFFKAEEVSLGDFCFLRIRTKGGNSAILNREIQNHYSLVVKAAIKGDAVEAWTKVNIQVLDMNDLRPLFSPTTYSVTIPENTPLRTSIAQVTATDADIGSNGEFYYYFKDRVDIFAVHPTSGIVSISGKLNYDERSQYDLEVLAVDRGMKLYGNNGVSSTAKLVIHIDRFNEHAPILSIVSHIPSLMDIDPIYAIITADDLDDGVNGEIESVSIVAGDPLEQFHLVRTGLGSREYRIKLAKTVNWEDIPYGYNLTLQAKDKGTPQKFSAVRIVHIKNLQENENRISFAEDAYEVQVNEFAPPGVVVVAVKLKPEPQNVKYNLGETEDAQYFSINPHTGLITTTQHIRILEREYFILEVMSNVSEMKVQVVIKVEDANDHTPEFLQLSYETSINESMPIGSSVLVVTATDNDQGENGYVTYSIRSLNPLPFVINQFTGVISTSELLDFESSPRSYRFFVRASDWGSPYRRENEVNVTVYVENVNDNKPLFEKVDCRGVISREFPVGEQITTVSAIDVDELELVKYRIVSGNELGFFDLNSDSGVLFLSKTLDSANPKDGCFTLQITATDGENIADPMFLNISLVHGKPPTKDYSCRETGVAKRLAEKLLKMVKVNNKPKMEDLFLDLYSINRQSPQFDKSFPSEIAIKEDLPTGSTIVKIPASDADSSFNGKVIYAISDGNVDSCFNIEMETGWLTVLMPMDRELTDKYILNITIYDLGSPPNSAWRLMTIHIQDANDNKPHFLLESYSVSIPEDTVIGTEIVQIEARDEDLAHNSEIIYTLLTHTPQFAINATTGMVYVTGLLDRESIANCTLKVEARDQADSGPQLYSVVDLVIVFVDVNDNAPRFVPSSYFVRVLEDMPVSAVVTWLEAHDPDLGLGGQVRYSLGNDYNGKFEIDRINGVVRLSKELDFEKQQFYNLTIHVKDKGRPISLSSASFIEIKVVDVNENLYAPQFLEFAKMASVKENAPVGTSVLQVTAKDGDGERDGQIRYSIRDGSGLGRFTVNENTGVINTADVLDRETTSSYWLTVYATDYGVVPLFSSIEIYIEIEDINDNAPICSQPIYHPSIMENSPKDVPIVQIQAYDPDSSSSDKMTFRITSGNPQNFFTINPKTGLIMSTSRKLDREQQAEHVLEVMVTDGSSSPKYSTVWVMVHVLDENDNKPLFPQKAYQIKLPERDRKKRSEPIYRTFAFDKDKGPNAEISYSIVDGNDDGKFFIDPKTGMVSSRKQFSAGNYDILTIKAVDNGRPQKSSTARLHIEWIKKPEPSSTPLSFDEPFYNFTVMESDRVNEIVGVVTVQPSNIPLWFDIVAGKQAREMFYVYQTACGQNCSREGGNYESVFEIEKGVGTLVIAKQLDAEHRATYNMTVEVTDGTNSATTQVFVRILDNNDNGPVFSKPSYDVTISEDAAINTEILHIKATDRDEKSKLTYSIHSSIDSISLHKFHLDHSTGMLSIAEKLDHEAQTQHSLTVMVRDQEFPYRRNLVRVIINVDDANDHAPYFTSAVYHSSVFESATFGSAVLQVTALDKDKGQNAELLYSIEGGNNENTFKIEPVLGIITVSKELDLSSLGQYILTVKASDQGFPALSATAIVRVSVTLSDNAQPKFVEKEYTIEINENACTGTSVIMISAVSKSTIVYEIRSGNPESVFAINPYSGVISVQKALDYEHIPFYQLIVQASNMAGMSSNVTVSIHVLDENDNLPIFLHSQYSGSISEAAPVNSAVLIAGNKPLVIRAADADCNQNALLVYQIVESTANKYFSVDSSTGAIRTIAHLDHETIPIFHFQVHVRDSGSPQLIAETPAEVTIYVIDINDSPPKFSQDVYEAVLLLPTYSGVEVLTVSATDPDFQILSELTYTLIDGNTGNYFLIDLKSGLVTVRNHTLIEELYRLTVHVSDGTFSSTALIKIRVKDAIDSGLQFTQSFYSSSILENSMEIKKVAVVNAVGNMLNEPLKYRILNPGDKFTIKSTSGIVQTMPVSFDREEQEFYELVVEASREHDPWCVARVVIQVQVEDINDNPPVFIGLPYYAAVQVDAEQGAVIYHITAVDHDKSKNGEVTYFLRDGYGHFEINQYTGIVMLKKPFEFDLSNVEYNVIVIAKDGGTPSLSTFAELPITVVNKAMPVFEKPFYSRTVNEDIPAFTPVLSINASSPEGQNLIYTITDGNSLNQFSINFETGVISVIRPLDYETESSYKITVKTTDSLTGAHAEATVDISVIDVNDNPPVFEKTRYEATLSESSMVGTPVLQVIALDADSENGRLIRYQIVQDNLNSTDYFHIDSTSGLILTSRMLDYELIRQYNFVARATDNGIPPMSTDVPVVVYVTDMNDSPPVFNQLLYESYVNELAPRGHFVTCVQASDVDSSDAEKLEYSILSGNDHMNFVMNNKRGIITLSNHRKQRMDSVYNLNVSVSDGVFTSTAQVHINVLGANLYSPVFSSNEYVVEMRENSAIGSKVIQAMATDGDSGEYGNINYFIVNDFARDRFSINSAGQMIVTEKLNREFPVEREINVTVMAVDGGGRAAYCTVKVILVDDNDNAPQFLASEYRTSVKADVTKGSLIIQVEAFDPDERENAKIIYSLYCEESDYVENAVDIDHETGWIVTKGNFDHLENTVLSFFVKASDCGIPMRSVLVPVYFHVLPPETDLPAFLQHQYTFVLPEDTPIGSTVGTIQVLAHQNLLFNIINGGLSKNNQDGIFVIDSHIGILKLDKRLDYETTPSYKFLVTVTVHNGKTDIILTTNVKIEVVDLNDNKPIFQTNPYEAVVMEGMPIGTKVIQIQAVDTDSGVNGQVVYSLLPEGQSELEEVKEIFAIDNNSGWIRTLKDLDHERHPTYTFTVVALDNGRMISLSSTAIVQVVVTDINDNAPHFVNDIYRGSVKESDSPGEVIAVLSTRDDDTSAINRQVSYHITGGNDKGKFALGLVQNEWKVYVKRPLDREEQDIYFLNITATDGLFVSRAVVEVRVLDANDNSPICDQVTYTETILEDITPNEVILRIGARDIDVGFNAEIRYSLHGTGSENFFLEPEYGELKTLSVLDREETEVYNLIARATDGGGRYCQSGIVLLLEDVNDNPPIFSSNHYTQSVYENTAIKVLLSKVEATDPDAGPNRDVEYVLVDSADGFFSIDKYSGIISLEKALDREQQVLYNLTVKATDQGTSRKLSAFTTVSIVVLDINDNPPVFERQDYLATIAEDVGLGTEVIVLYAASKDFGANAEITYNIRSGNEHGKFKIDPQKGIVSVIEYLDYETCKGYYLTVEARDGGSPSLSAVTTVNVNITDVNDNAPEFSREIYNAVISEDASIGDSVVKVLAEDCDSEINAQIHFSIVNGDPDNYFNISPVTGLIKVKERLDREKISGYSLTVQAKDTGTHSMSSTVTVNIDVSDINDNPPDFIPANYSAVIQENKSVGTNILHLSVTDKDSSHNGPPFIFTIVAGNDGNEFVLDQQGVLRSTIVFKQRDATEYLLHVQAEDSGKPPLSSSTYILVNVIEESIHKPTAIPLEIFISTIEDEFPGGVIGKIHATDQDMYDILTYGLKSDQRSLFTINGQDGKLIALGGLDSGNYILNVSVSDGRFTIPVEVVVHVEQVTQDMLNNAISIQFKNISPEDFVGLHLHGFRQSLRNIIAAQKHDTIHIISIQPVAATQQLEVLLAVQMYRSGFYRSSYLIQKLSNAKNDLPNDLHISTIMDKSCSAEECKEQYCEQVTAAETQSMMTYSTARISFVSPRYFRDATCTCNGDICPIVSDACQEKPCPNDMHCVQGGVGQGPYTCQCPPGNLGECSGHASLSFAGNSYIKYRVAENNKRDELKLGLHLRTLQSNGIIMYAEGDYCVILKIVDGKLWFQLDCGNGPGIVGISGRTVNDGNWHTVFLDLNKNFTSLALDDSYVERRWAPFNIHVFSIDNYIYFGAQVPAAHGLLSHKSAQVLGGFQGCLDSVVLNDNQLPLQNKHSHFAEVVGLTELKLGCVLYPDTCAREPCQNGGICISQPSGGYQCSCLPQFTGNQCEIEVTSCFPNPCQNGGSCNPLGSDFACDCKEGFMGLMCEEDIDECNTEECQNGGMCLNTLGSFQCNCTSGYIGLYCDLRPFVVPNIQPGHPYVGKEEFIGIAVILLVLMILVILFAIFRKKVFKKHARNNMTVVQDPATAALLNKPNGIQFKGIRNNGGSRKICQEAGGPPQVPVRPVAYTPCFHSDSRNNLDKIDGMQMEHQEMSTFHPESPQLLTARRGIVVCSVAPNLPTVTRAVSAYDSLRKNTWDRDRDGKADIIEDAAGFTGSTKGSNSEVQSLNSFQSDSCDDNVSLTEEGQNYNRAYHWDTSDWMPSTRLPNIEEVPHYEAADTAPVHHEHTRSLDADYYLGGYDIDSDFPPPQDEEFLGQDQLPPPLPEDYQDQYEIIQSPETTSTLNALNSNGRRPHFHPSQYLPPHQLPAEGEPVGIQDDTDYGAFSAGSNQDLDKVIRDNISMPVLASTNASSSDMSPSCGFDDSEVVMTDYESDDELNFDNIHISFVESQYQTQV
ncbi:protocadherin Fat 3a isoform X2 [Stegostoma tigrinum]|uniref:protocadherin Fat 3a isoform X2 n=1 Tax=Stegostoma tigrinum TaxID=3053191 RepID=UPI002870689B|nr:protocadherin Fat 3a isoform X2 [Stegostoma tigrinum]